MSAAVPEHRTAVEKAGRGLNPVTTMSTSFRRVEHDVLDVKNRWITSLDGDTEFPRM